MKMPLSPTFQKWKNYIRQCLQRRHDPQSELKPIMPNGSIFEESIQVFLQTADSVYIEVRSPEK
jgi:hypothetical protein